MKEVYEAYQSFRRLVSSATTCNVDISDLADSKKEEWISSFRDKVDCNDLYLTGHSFGGGTIVCPAHPSNPADNCIAGLATFSAT